MDVTVFIPWNQDRRMPVFEGHLSVEEMENAVMSHYGILTKKVMIRNIELNHFTVVLKDHPDIGWDVYHEVTVKL